jgi:hypothetical protein
VLSERFISSVLDRDCKHPPATPLRDYCTGRVPAPPAPGPWTANTVHVTLLTLEHTHSCRLEDRFRVYCCLFIHALDAGTLACCIQRPKCLNPQVTSLGEEAFTLSQLSGVGYLMDRNLRITFGYPITLTEAIVHRGGSENHP